ncbi:MAG: 50S ribosomal protein L7 [Eubacteriales bacterium]|nr:50S ribosomal protein L7 [Eubacteriales bacterium]
MNKILNLLGLAKKAGKLEVGEEPTGAAARAKDARLLLIASDAADNSFRRLRHFADAGACLYAKLPCTKDELGRAVGRTSCAMVAVTDIGFAEAVAGKLAEEDAARYSELAEKLSIKAQRAMQRRKEQEQHEKNLRTGKRKVSAKEEKTEELQSREEKKPKAGIRKSRSRKEREKMRREGEKRENAKRFANARPVKHGKGSVKREKNDKIQHMEV